MSDVNEAVWTAWLAERPLNVREVAEHLRPDTCYRSTENRGHYCIRSYDEEKAGGVTLHVIHGADSFLPGFGVFGVDPGTMRACGCGNWEPFAADDCAEGEPIARKVFDALDLEMSEGAKARGKG